MVAQEIGLELLEKAQRGSSNIGALTDLHFSTVQLHTPKDKGIKKNNWMSISTNITKETHKNRKERKGEKEERGESMEISTLTLESLCECLK